MRSVEGAEDDVTTASKEMDTHKVGASDVVIGIAASGSTPYVKAALSRAKALGARIGLVSCSEPPTDLRRKIRRLHHRAGGPEIVTGSTRMKAGTATKLVLNTLTTGAMIRLGKVYGNLMVDLRAWNDKLVDRSQRIVMETTGLDRSRAQTVIKAADGSVKTAIVMARRGVAKDEAERLLAEHAGRLRPIVGDPPAVQSR